MLVLTYTRLLCLAQTSYKPLSDCSPLVSRWCLGMCALCGRLLVMSLLWNAPTVPTLRRIDTNVDFFHNKNYWSWIVRTCSSWPRCRTVNINLKGLFIVYRNFLYISWVNMRVFPLCPCMLSNCTNVSSLRGVLYSVPSHQIWALGNCICIH